jgi:hypothetical protein
LSSSISDTNISFTTPLLLCLRPITPLLLVHTHTRATATPTRPHPSRPLHALLLTAPFVLILLPSRSSHSSDPLSHPLHLLPTPLHLII